MVSDEVLKEELRAVTSRRGMKVAAYLRKLISEALELRRRGIYAPKALADARVQYILKALNFIYVPAELIPEPNEGDLRKVREYGVKLGKTLKNLGINVGEVIKYLGEQTGTIIHEEGKIIVKPETGSKKLTTELIKGIATGAELKIIKDKEIFIAKE